MKIKTKNRKHFFKTIYAFRILLALLAICALIAPFCGCTSAKPLKLRKYSKNLIVHSDRTLSVDNTKIDFNNLKSELVSRMIFEQTPITLHVHKDVPEDAFNTLIQKLNNEGYKRISAVLYKD